MWLTCWFISLGNLQRRWSSNIHSGKRNIINSLVLRILQIRFGLFRQYWVEPCRPMPNGQNLHFTILFYHGLCMFFQGCWFNLEHQTGCQRPAMSHPTTITLTHSGVKNRFISWPRPFNLEKFAWSCSMSSIAVFVGSMNISSQPTFLDPDVNSLRLLLQRQTIFKPLEIDRDQW
jgi:hypothetical protein